MNYFCFIDTPIGMIKVVSDGENLIGLDTENTRFPYEGKDSLEMALPIFQNVKKWLNQYFNGEVPNVTLQMAPEGNEFRKKVWSILCEIPYGETITYGDIARRIESENNCRMSAQAVGNAVGHNPIGIIIPCHRVIGANGSLVGYGGGLELKKYLLSLEKRNRP